MAEREFKGKVTGGTDAEQRDIINALMAAQAHARSVHGEAALREPETTVDDVLWNAVVMGHGDRFDTMPKVFQFAGLLTTKLSLRGALPTAAQPYAPQLLAGLLYWTWRGQNLNYLAPDVTEGQAGTLREAVKELQQLWSPADGKDWYARIQTFPAVVGMSALFLTPSSTKEEIQPELDRLAGIVNSSLSAVAEYWPEALPGATAWMMGCLIERNTFPDGHPAGQMLEVLCMSIEKAAEQLFHPWLMAGFQSGREDPLEDVDGWRLHR
jgi:hypothetical protein